MNFCGIGCPFLFLFRVPCPTCGVTRALVCLLKGDLKGYFFYHPLAVLLVISVFLMLHIKLFKRRRVIAVFVNSLLSVNACFYFIRFFC